MPTTHRRPLTRLALAALAAAAAVRCSCPSSSSPPPATPLSGVTPAGTAPPPVEPEQLAPLIEPTGAPGVLPSGVVISFSRPIAGEEQVGRPAGEKTAIRMEPAVRGAWLFTDRSTLLFRPQEPFAFDTAYTVTLEAVEAAAGPIQAPRPEAWKAQFTTPRYAFLRMSPHKLDLRGGKVAVDLVFSGPVDVPVLRRMAAFTVDGNPISDVKLASLDALYVARATLSSGAFQPGGTVKLALRAGTTSAGRRPQVAPGAEASFALFGGRQTKIHASEIREGPTGFFVEVFCQDDKPAPGEGGGGGEEEGESYGGEDGDDEGGYQWWRYRPGCMLQDSEAADAVHFTPEVKFSLAPSRGGFRLFGDFKRGSYTLRIDAGVGTVAGGMLYSTFERQFTFGPRTPKVGFAASGRYLPRSAWRSLAVTHLNVDAVQLSVRHVPPENLVFWLSDSDDERASDRSSDLLLERTVPVKGEADAQATTWVDVGSLVPSTTRGVVEVTARDPHGSSSASSRLLLTGMSLVAKKAQLGPGQKAGTEEVWVWAIGIDSLETLSGVEVSLVRRSGKVVGRCTTAGAGGCKLRMEAGDPDPAPPFALVARKGEDLTYLRYEDLKTDTTDSDTAGEPYASEAAYRAALYADRGVYRPGDVAHLVAVLRGQDHLAPAAGLPAHLEVTDPRGRLARKLSLKTNEAGLVSLDLPFASFADTGRYDVELKVADRVAGRHSILVEEFVPERMKVTVSAEQAAYALGATVPLRVEARYLFGGSAAGSPAAADCRLEPSVFKPKENAQFTYGVWVRPGAEVKALTLGQVKGELDDNGQATLSCPGELSAGFKGPARLVAQAAVMEAGSGRATVGEAAVPVHPEAYYLGLLAGAQKVEAGKAFQVSGVVVDWNGALAGDRVKQVEVELSRLEEEYSWSWDESAHEERYQRWLRPVREGRSKAGVQGGKFTIGVTPSQGSAGYLVRVKAGNAQTDLQLEGSGRYYWHSSESRVEQTPKPMRPASLALSVPAVVKVGEKVKVSFKAPYPGRVLFTAETHQVLAAEWKEASAGENSWTFPLEAFAPNVYVSAFLVKDPHLESKEAFTPDRAFGVTSVPVEPSGFIQPVALKAPEEIRSNSPLTVELDLGATGESTYATVAAVDEGILQLTRFQSPDPLAALFARRMLGVETYETVGWTLLVPPQGPQKETGGDGEGGGAGRVQPVKPVALWSGLLKVGADGKAKVTFQVPQYRGALRVMAVTTSSRRVGRASATVLVRDPIVLSTTLPRFLSMGDEIQIPVFVTNLSGGPLELKVQLAAEDLPVPGTLAVEPQPPPLELLGQAEGTLKLPSGKAGTLVFQARAVKATGAARLRVTAKGGGHESREELEVPFLPAGPKERVVQRIELAEGTTDLKPFLRGWLANSESSTIWVTNNPYGESFDHLKHLLRYPYGCIEQTTSSTRPLLFVSNLIESVDPALVARAGVEDMVMAGVNRVFSMQTAEGGFGYWPGDTHPVGWGTAYATHLLIDAEKLGYPVPADRLQDALAWIGKEATRLENRQLNRDEEEDVHGRWEDAHDAEPYLHLVLAMKGQGRKARLQRLIDALPKKKDGPAVEKEHLLKAALYLAGDRRYEKELRNPDASPVSAERLNRWDFYSDARRRGLMLSTFQDLFGNDPAGEPLAQRVADHLRGRPSAWYTTQELVWSVTGLGKRLQGMNKAFQPAELSANGKALKPNPPRAAGKGQAAVASSDRTWAIPRASQLGALAVGLKDQGEGKVFALISSEGVREHGDYRVGGEGLRLQRRWRTLEGDAVGLRSGSGAKLADLLYVEVELTNISGGPIQNVALVDRLPAGFEIENPRLGRGAPVRWVDRDSLWSADFMNVRDDRIELFGTLERGQTRKVVYAVRVVTAGKFTIPPVEAEAMYDPRIWAREAGGTVEVAGPWKDFLL